MWFAGGGVCPVLVWGPLLGSEARPPVLALGDAKLAGDAIPGGDAITAQQ